jgi:hypothetical protein
MDSWTLGEENASHLNHDPYLRFGTKIRHCYERM